MNSTQQMFHRLHTELISETVEMEAEAHAVALALCTGTHLFFLGTPGIAKSFIVDRATARIANNNHFHILLGNFTGPEEMFGPLDLPALKAGRYRYLTEGYLPWATTAFLDEAWKGSDAILNAQLALLNERKFRNDGKWLDVPLSTAFLASNELPSNESLAAIYDRIEQRLIVTDIQEVQNFIDMLKLEVPKTPGPVLEWADVERAKGEVSQVQFNPDTFEAVAEIRRDLKKLNIEPSPRRFKRAMRLLQGEAWLDECDTVEPDHVSVLKDILWNQPEQKDQVEKTVLERVNPLEKETRQLLANIMQIGDMVAKAQQATDEDERQNLGMEAHPRLVQASDELTKIEKKAGNSKRQQALIASCKSKIHANAAVLKKDIFLFGQPGGGTLPTP